jgi:hypothetical protein
MADLLAELDKQALIDEEALLKPVIEEAKADAVA